MNNEENNSVKFEKTTPNLESYRKIDVNYTKMPPHTGVNPPGSPKPARSATPAEQYAFYFDQLRSKR